MDPLTMGLLSGGANLLGSVFSSLTSASNTNQQLAAQEGMLQQSEQFNAGQAQLQRDYQTQMSNTAYQRASADMKAAGLNPMMMFGSGGAASTPSGATASVGTPSAMMPQKQSPLAGVGNAVNAAIGSAVTAKTMDKLSEEVANLQADNSKLQAQTDLIKASTTGQAQKNIIGLPDETKAQLFNDWLRKHPNLTTASEVTKLGGETASAVTGPASDMFGRRFLGDLMTGFSSTAKDKLRSVGLSRLRDSGAGLGSYTFEP